MKPRMLDLVFVLIGSASLLAPTPTQATQFELPVFDTHVHLRTGQETNDLELLQAAGVTAGALLIGSSTALQDLAGGRIVSSHISPAFLNATRTGYTTVRGQSASQFVQEELAAGKRVVAELALRHTHIQSAIPADDPESMAIYRVAGSFGVPVMLHYEIDDDGTTYNQEYLNQLKNALSRCQSDAAAQCANTKFIWAHLGDARADIISSMLRDHPNLYVDIAARNPFFVRGRELSFQTLTTTTSAPFALKPEWRSLFQSFPDRVMFGMDLDDDSRWSEIQNAATADNRLMSYYNEIFQEICADDPMRCQYNATSRTYTLTNDATLKNLAELNAKRLLGLEALASTSITKRFLLSFHACNTATANCNDPQNHQVYLAESDDGASWSMVGGWTPYQGSVPDVIRRGQTIYIYTPGKARRFSMDTNTWEDPVSVTLTDPEFTGFVDPSLFVDESGQLMLFYFATNTASGDPAACPAGTTCISHFRSATEVAGSDGTAFIADDGDRVSVTISPTVTNPDTATDPDIFFDGTQYVLYISRGNSIQVYTSPTLRGAYTLSPNLPEGFLTQNIGGIGSGVFDTATNRYWTFVHAPSVGTRAKIRRAVHPTLGTALQASDLAEVVSAESIGLGSSSTLGVESPGIALNAMTSSAWSGWTSVPGGGATPSGPTAILDGSQVHLVIRGMDGGVWTGLANNPQWTSLPGQTPSTPAAVMEGSTLHLFIQGLDNQLWTNSRSGGNWSGWTSVPGGGATPSGPTAILDGSQVHLVIRGMDGGVWTGLANNPQWTSLPGQTPSTPAAVMEGSTLHLFIQGLDNQLWTNSRSGGNWGSWTSVPGGGATPSGPTAILDGSTLRIYIRGMDNQLWTNSRSVGS